MLPRIHARPGRSGLVRSLLPVLMFLWWPAILPAASESAHYAPALGERKVAVLLVNFLDNPGEPGTVDQAYQAMESVNDYFEESSYNQAYLNTDVYGWWTLPYETSRCSEVDGYPVSAEILDEAARRGVDLSGYDHLIYVFSESFGVWCSSGAGTFSPGYQGKVWRSWIDPVGSTETAFDGTKGIETTIHELGHNLGLWHANRLDCGTEVLGANCVTVGYADFYDSMGSSSIGPHFNAFHKERLGWISSDVTSPNQISTITRSGTFLIDPYAADGGVKALRIRRGPNATGGVDHFYLEFRQPIGWDAGFAQHAYEGILVHLGNDTLADSSRLLDMTPGEMWEHVLRPGRPFYDPVSDVTLEVLSVSGDGALVDIIIGTDITPPNVALISPLEGDVLTSGSLVNLVARASDETAMGQVNFYVDGVLRCSVTTPSAGSEAYSCAYSVPKGRARSLTISAQAVDTAGNTATSSVQVSTKR